MHSSACTALHTKNSGDGLSAYKISYGLTSGPIWGTVAHPGEHRASMTRFDPVFVPIRRSRKAQIIEQALHGAKYTTAHYATRYVKSLSLMCCTARCVLPPGTVRRCLHDGALSTSVKCDPRGTVRSDVGHCEIVIGPATIRTSVDVGDVGSSAHKLVLTAF